ncbi:MAG: tRNA (adenosine(37)-N6)-threonylcarbamoyltransferase complex ATPase subunit type 1 TsaE [Elusimicrobiota bacterium]
MKCLKTRTKTLRFSSYSPEETACLAEKILKICRARQTRLILLSGNLGSGKTVFVQGLARTLDVKNWVKSPSFVLIQEYRIPKGRFYKRLIHADLYRLDSAKDLSGLNLGDYLEDPGNLVAIEWAEKLPRAFWRGEKTVQIFFKPGRRPDFRAITVKKPYD